MDNAELVKKVEALEERIKALEDKEFVPASQSLEQKQSKQVSVREFLLTKELNSSKDVTLAIGHYLESHTGLPSFNISDIEKAFRQAKIKPPANINDMVNKNINKGMVMEAEEKREGKKAWVLTGTGEEYINNKNKKDEKA